MTTKTPHDSFSAREQEVVGLLLQGKSNKEIARELGITIRTVESHLGSIFAKLGVTSRTSAVIKLHERSLWNSTAVIDGQITGNPQLTTNSKKATLSSKALHHRFFFGRIVTKNLIRMITLVLLAVLLIVLVTAKFAAIRQLPENSMHL